MVEKKFLVKDKHMVTLAPNGMLEDKDETVDRKTYSFGKITDYIKGDVVYCRGKQPCIGVIQCRAASEKPEDIRFFISRKFNSISFKNIRYAKKKEAILLGKKRVIPVREEAHG
jgi:hypothetical protein